MSAYSYAEVVESALSDERELIDVQLTETHALIRLNDPEKLNPLSAPLTLQLHRALQRLCGDPAVRTVVLTGSDPAFSAGGDLRLMREVAHPMVDRGPDGASGAWEWIRNEFGAIAKLITRTDKTFIAAVNGAAAGVGLSFALACDLILVSEQARLVPAFGRIGLVPEVGQSWLLTRRLGYQGAFELFATGRHLGGREAYERGLANAVVPHQELLRTVQEWCEQLTEVPRHVLKMMKPLLRNAAEMTWEQAIAMEEFAEPMCFTTQAHRAAVTELLADRPSI
jgi:2-(1,2-epoxy-1,2-dihydrophenyl)acetyl-CoA isomerase